MNPREKILTKLRKQFVEQVTLPNVVEGDWIHFDDPIQQFKSSVEFVGGDCAICERSEIPKLLKQFAEWDQAERVFSKIPEVTGNVELTEVDDPHDLENLDFVIYPGEFAVAENGAIWLTDQDLRHRVIFFITQFLVLVVEKESIVHTMHEAYQRAKPRSPGFGLFLAGPSKTADIEQSLVIGAHGCKELQVFIV